MQTLLPKLSLSSDKFLLSKENTDYKGQAQVKLAAL